MLADAMPQGRGWVMAGPTGCGKTARARVAARALGIRMRAADAMVMQAASDGAGEGAVLDAGCLGLGRFSHRQEVNDLIIDDLGREQRECVLWGERRDIMREILERRLDAWPHIRTYATTNLTEAELAERYGARVASRLAQAAMLLRMPARDWRREGSEQFGWGMA